MSQSQRRGQSRLSFAAILLAAITIPVALITMIGLTPIPGLEAGLPLLSQGIIQIAVVTGAVAVIIGVLNLSLVHFQKLLNGSLYSLVVLITFVAVLVLHFLEGRGILKVTTASGTVLTDPVATLTLFNAIQVTIESALAGLLFFFLVYSAYRLMRRRVTIWNILFVLALLIVLIGYIPGTPFTALRDWLLQVPVNATTRGLLIGVALGTVVVGVRVLLGQDRLFRG